MVMVPPMVIDYSRPDRVSFQAMLQPLLAGVKEPSMD